MNIKKLTQQLYFFENMIKEFAESKLEKAYDLFLKKEGYDLRDTDNNDHLRFATWYLSKEGGLVLEYTEVTPHDIPSGVTLRYPTTDLNIEVTQKENSELPQVLKWEYVDFEDYAHVARTFCGNYKITYIVTEAQYVAQKSWSSVWVMSHADLDKLKEFCNRDWIELLDKSRNTDSE